MVNSASAAHDVSITHLDRLFRFTDAALLALTPTSELITLSFVQLGGDPGLTLSLVGFIEEVMLIRDFQIDQAKVPMTVRTFLPHKLH